MAKIISYKIQCGEDLLPAVIECPTQAIFDANYPIAEKEAVGKIIVDGEFEPEPFGDSVWDELDAAYQEGVNSAYDQ